MQKDEIDDTVILEMSRDDFERLKRCFAAMQDVFEINRMFDESCARLGRGERKELDRFVDKFLAWRQNTSI